jgi:hypothetical protein
MYLQIQSKPRSMTTKATTVEEWKQLHDTWTVMTRPVARTAAEGTYTSLLDEATFAENPGEVIHPRVSCGLMEPCVHIAMDTKRPETSWMLSRGNTIISAANSCNENAHTYHQACNDGASLDWDLAAQTLVINDPSRNRSVTIVDKSGDW